MESNTETALLTEGESSSQRPPQRRAELRPLDIRGDEYVLFALPHLDHSRRPVVSLGKSPKTGKLQLHFRVYAKNGRVKSAKWDMTQAGCTLSPAEFDDVIEK